MADIDIKITQELLLLITEIDQFKGKWRALNTLVLSGANRVTIYERTSGGKKDSAATKCRTN